MREPKEQLLTQALELHQSGAKMKEILAETGLNYSQAWLYITDAELAKEDRITDPNRTPATVRRLRDEEHQSWGLISVRFGYKEFPETKVRKMYTEETGVRSQGLRIGRGGMHFARNPLLYKGVRKRKGVKIPKDMMRMEVDAVAGELPDDVDDIKARSNGHKPSMKTAAKAEGVIKQAKKAGPVKKAAAKKGVKAGTV